MTVSQPSNLKSTPKAFGVAPCPITRFATVINRRGSRGMRVSSNRSEGNQAGDSVYRELLADRIAEAIVEQRYGAGVYRPSPQIAAQLRPQAEPAGSGTNVAPAGSL